MKPRIAKSGTIHMQRELFTLLSYLPPEEPKSPPAPPRPKMSYAQAYTAMLDALQNDVDPWQAEIDVDGKTYTVNTCSKDGDWSVFDALRAAEIEMNYKRMRKEDEEAELQKWLDSQPPPDWSM